MDELTAWCTARGFTAKMTAVVVDAYVDLETLRACVDPADAMDEALAEEGLARGPRKVVLKAVRTLLEPAPPVAAPPPVQFAAPQPANVAAPQPVRAPAPVSPEPDPKPVQASTPPEPRFQRGWGWMFSRHVTQADKGCDFDFLEAGEKVDEPDIN